MNTDWRATLVETGQLQVPRFHDTEVIGTRYVSGFLEGGRVAVRPWTDAEVKAYEEAHARWERIGRRFLPLYTRLRAVDEDRYYERRLTPVDRLRLRLAEWLRAATNPTEPGSRRAIITGNVLIGLGTLERG